MQVWCAKMNQTSRIGLKIILYTLVFMRWKLCQYFRYIALSYQTKHSIMKITFYARGRVVQARLCAGDDYYRLSTGITIHPHLRFSNGEFKGRSLEVAELNSELARMKVRLTELYFEYKDFKLVKDNFTEKPAEIPQGETYLIHELLRKYVQLMATGEIKSSSKKKYSDASTRLYRHVSNLLSEFCHFYEDIDIRDYHIDATWDSMKKREVAEKFNRYWKKYEDYMIDRELGVKSRSEYMNITGVMINYWADKLFFTLPKIPRLSKHEKAIVVLPSEFVKSFLNDEDRIYSSLTPELKTIWEISATILITTLRIGDAMSLNEHNFVFRKDMVFMRKKNEKTGVFSEMPIPQQIANLYRENLSRYGRIYTLEPNKDLVYANMKDLFRMYEDLHETVSVAQLDTRGNEFIVTKPLWEWVHPHLLRKTAITNMIYNKVPERFIKFASGHAVNSHAFERYVGHVEKYYKSEINDYYGKIFS